MRILLFIIIYLYLIKPNNSRKDALIPYHEKYICHRGFHNNKDVPENSLLAFRKAVDNNYNNHTLIINKYKKPSN